MGHIAPQKPHVLPTLLWVSKKSAGDILLREHLFGDLRGKKKGPREGPLLTSVVAPAQGVLEPTFCHCFPSEPSRAGIGMVTSAA